MVYVCDSIMGTGKTCAAINYMNSHPDGRYIYITPFLSEAERISDACPGLGFVQPTSRRTGNDHTKVGHTKELVLAGKNVATTHASFNMYDAELLDAIRRQGYTLVADESVDVLEALNYSPCDISLLRDGGYLECTDGNTYRMTDKKYAGGVFSGLMKLIGARDVFRVGDTDTRQDCLYYWMLPPEMFAAFKDVYVLTYLFEGQNLHCLFRMYNMEYEKIGVHRVPSGGDATQGFVFGGYPGYTPEYVAGLPDMIDVYDGKLNDVGDDATALSHTWFLKHGDGSPEVKRLHDNIYNYFNNITGRGNAGLRLWSTFADERQALQGAGYTKGFLSFNSRATNSYRDRCHLAYALNIYAHVGKKMLYKSMGIGVDEDKYALSVMVQWIWRSAIRDGKKVCIYIPSRRMRELLTGWISEVSGRPYVYAGRG